MTLFLIETAGAFPKADTSYGSVSWTNLQWYIQLMCILCK